MLPWGQRARGGPTKPVGPAAVPGASLGSSRPPRRDGSPQLSLPVPWMNQGCDSDRLGGRHTGRARQRAGGPSPGVLPAKQRGGRAAQSHGPESTPQLGYSSTWKSRGANRGRIITK